jgi:hypothetical protein
MSCCLVGIVHSCHHVYATGNDGSEERCWATAVESRLRASRGKQSPPVKLPHLLCCKRFGCADEYAWITAVSSIFLNSQRVTSSPFAGKVSQITSSSTSEDKRQPFIR